MDLSQIECPTGAGKGVESGAGKMLKRALGRAHGSEISLWFTHVHVNNDRTPTDSGVVNFMKSKTALIAFVCMPSSKDIASETGVIGQGGRG